MYQWQNLRILISKKNQISHVFSFYIPCTRLAYPREWQGLDLASTVYDMKWWLQNVKQQRDRVQELNEMGFLWERLQSEWNLVLEALITYVSIHGNAMVPISFVVPHGDDTVWPASTWGIPLGNCVYRIRNRNDFLRDPNTAHSRRDQLDRLGFCWDVQEYRFRKFYDALKLFAHYQKEKEKNIGHSHSALRVPSTFTVPHKSKHWPKELWGYPLGAKCAAVRQKGLYVKNNPERQLLLQELRFQWSGNASLGWLEVVHAAAIYSRLHQRNLDVKYNFVVPAPPEASASASASAPTESDSDDDTCNSGMGTTGDEEEWPWPGKTLQ